MQIKLFQEIARSSGALLQAQFSNLRTQIPLMYVLMALNAALLAFATYGEVPDVLSIGGGAILCMIIAIRGAVWRARPAQGVGPARIRQYLMGTIFASIVLSAAFGAWGLLLLDETDPGRSTAIALYVFVGAISCCYCLQAFPAAGWFVLLFGAMPITVRLLFSHDWYLVATGVDFVVAAGVILRSLATSHTAFTEVLRSRGEMGELIAELERSREHYRYSIELNPQIPWHGDASGSIRELSPRWSQLTGLPLEDGLGWGWLEAVHPQDRAQVESWWESAVSSGEGQPADMRYRLRLADGSYRWFRARGFPRLDQDGTVLAWYGNLEDIEEQVAAELALQESEERYRLASLAANDIIWDFSLERDHIAWSTAAASLLGYPETLGGTNRDWWVERIHPEDRPRVLAELSHAVSTGQSHWVQEFRVRTASGAILRLVSHGHIVRDRGGKPTRIIGSLQDVTTQRLYEEKLQWAARHDPLTGLPSRAYFNERLDAALRHAVENGREALLIILDLDRFKTVNDDWGHDAGDAMLKEVATRLRRAVPESGMVARLGGDEFAIILSDLDAGQPEAATIESLLAQVMGPTSFRERQLEISISAGAARAPAEGSTADELHKSADLALYAAKREGFGRLRFFRPELRRAAERDTQMLQDARTALSENRIIPYYQPKVSLRTGACIGFEALLRWHHPSGIRPPQSIKAAFDDPAISVQLTDRMLDRVIEDITFWRDSGIDAGRIAINGSAADFRRGDLADRILQRLHLAGLPSSVLELEVTETVFVSQEVMNVAEILRTLSQAGVTIALDDFGTGYASLTHLKQFPVDTIKIDRSFISRLGKAESEDNAIVSAVIGLARSLGVTTVAEGIETTAQAAHLVRHQCDIGQGFLFGRPMPAARVADVIQNWTPSAALAMIGWDDSQLGL